jgi:hypothetical protein
MPGSLWGDAPTIDGCVRARRVYCLSEFGSEDILQKQTKQKTPRQPGSGGCIYPVWIGARENACCSHSGWPLMIGGRISSASPCRKTGGSGTARRKRTAAPNTAIRFMNSLRRQPQKAVTSSSIYIGPTPAIKASTSDSTRCPTPTAPLSGASWPPPSLVTRPCFSAFTTNLTGSP